MKKIFERTIFLFGNFFLVGLILYGHYSILAQIHSDKSLILIFHPFACGFIFSGINSFTNEDEEKGILSHFFVGVLFAFFQILFMANESPSIISATLLGPLFLIRAFNKSKPIGKSRFLEL